MAYVFTRREREDLEAACRFMERELHRKIRLVEICRVSGMNRNKLNTGFHKFYGKNIRNFLLELRMQRAKALLQLTDLALWEVAEQTGYAHCNNFLTRYKKFHGYSAGRERNRQAGGNEES